MARVVILAALAATAMRVAQVQSLDQKLLPYLKQFGLPAISAAVFKQGVIIAAGKAGMRRVDTEIPVTVGDRFHLGSDSKAFAAVLIGAKLT